MSVSRSLLLLRHPNKQDRQSRPVVLLHNHAASFQVFWREMPAELLIRGMFAGSRTMWFVPEEGPHRNRDFRLIHRHSSAANHISCSPWAAAGVDALSRRVPFIFGPLMRTPRRLHQLLQPSAYRPRPLPSLLRSLSHGAVDVLDCPSEGVGCGVWRMPAGGGRFDSCRLFPR